METDFQIFKTTGVKINYLYVREMYIKTLSENLNLLNGIKAKEMTDSSSSAKAVSHRG